MDCHGHHIREPISKNKTKNKQKKTWTHETLFLIFNATEHYVIIVNMCKCFTFKLF